MWAVMSHSSWLRQRKAPAAPPLLRQSDDRATRLKQPGSLSCCRKDSWPGASPRLTKDSENKKYTFVVLSFCDLGIVCYHTIAQLTWENKLSGHPKGTKNPSKTKCSTVFHLIPEKPAYLPSVLVNPPDLRFCSFPLHPQAWMKKLHWSSFNKFSLIVIKVLSKKIKWILVSSTFKRMMEIIQRLPKNHFWGGKK